MLRILPSPLAMIALVIVLILALVISMLRLSSASRVDPILEAAHGQSAGSQRGGMPGDRIGVPGSGGSIPGADGSPTRGQPAGGSGPRGTATPGSPGAGINSPGSPGATNTPGSPGAGLATGEVVVQVSGAVKNPSVVTVAAGARGIDAVEKAGGLREDADLSSINLAQVLVDGQHLHVFKIGEVPPGTTPNVPGPTGTSPAGAPACIDIRTADESQLETLDGIGPALAKRIVEYRTASGFDNPEDVQNVPGIGAKKFAAFQEQLCR